MITLTASKKTSKPAAPHVIHKLLGTCYRCNEQRYDCSTYKHPIMKLLCAPCKQILLDKKAAKQLAENTLLADASTP